MTKMLIDCDPGHDDAIAILFAARRCELVGITTTHGNATLENTTRNALAICTLAGLDVPVAKGCDAPLVGAATHAGDIHGRTGLDGAELPVPDRGPIATHAVDFIIETENGIIAVESKLASTVADDDVQHLLWLRDRLGDRCVDTIVVHTGPEAYRRPDGVAVVPLALLGP